MWMDTPQHLGSPISAHAGAEVANVAQVFERRPQAWADCPCGKGISTPLLLLASQCQWAVSNCFAAPELVATTARSGHELAPCLVVVLPTTWRGSRVRAETEGG